MKSKDFKRSASQAVTSFVLFAFIVSGSLVTLASSKPVGEILISGSSIEEGKAVTVNGEPAKTGRTIFASSVITTPAGMTAVVNLGKAGRIQLAPDSSFTLSSAEGAIAGDLTAGSLTVLSSSSAANVKTLGGDVVPVSAGEVITAGSRTAAKKAQTGPGGLDWWVWAAIVGGAVTAVVLIVTLNDDETVTSPVR